MTRSGRRGRRARDPEVVADTDPQRPVRRAAPPEAAYRQALDAATNAWRAQGRQMQRRRRYLQIGDRPRRGDRRPGCAACGPARAMQRADRRVAALERIVGTLELGARPMTLALLHDDSAVLRAGRRGCGRARAVAPDSASIAARRCGWPKAGGRARGPGETRAHCGARYVDSGERSCVQGRPSKSSRRRRRRSKSVRSSRSGSGRHVSAPRAGRPRGARHGDSCRAKARPANSS